jgi:predicted amidophosphoribosyltransferase
MTKYIDLKGLEHYTECFKQYINMKIELSVNKSTLCPNCGAPITSSKCEYCGTDFEASAMWGKFI